MGHFEPVLNKGIEFLKLNLFKCPRVRMDLWGEDHHIYNNRIIVYFVGAHIGNKERLIYYNTDINEYSNIHNSEVSENFFIFIKNFFYIYKFF